MPTKKCLQKFVLLTMTPCAILSLHAQSSRNVRGIALDRLELHNVKAEAVIYDGKPAVRVDAPPNAANGALVPEASPSQGAHMRVQSANATALLSIPFVAPGTTSRWPFRVGV
jgi:hypothetical protein